MFQGPGASRATRRLPRGAGSILNGAYPSELFPPCQLCRVAAVCTLSLLVAVVTGPSARVAVRIRSSLGGSLNLRALVRQGVRCARPGVAAESPLGAPLGLDPLEKCACPRPSGPEGPSAPLPSQGPPKGVARHRQRDFPFGSYGAPKSLVASEPRWVRRIRPSEEGWLRRAREGSSRPSFRRGMEMGVLGKRGTPERLSEERRQARASRTPEGRLTRAPGERSSSKEQAPSIPIIRRASAFRRRSSVRSRTVVPFAWSCLLAASPKRDRLPP
jgi:hypothetical protein